MKVKPCPECGSSEIYQYKKDFYGPGVAMGESLVPGLGKHIFTFAKIRTTMCQDCGLVCIYASEDARKRLKTSKHWKHMKSA